MTGTALSGKKYKAYSEYKESGVEWLDCLPLNWKTVSLKMLLDVRDGTHDTPSYVEPSLSSYPLVTSKDVTGGEINLTNCKQISKEDYRSIIKRSAVSLGDILMPMIGTVGSPILINNNPNIAIKNLALFKTSAKQSQIETKYLLYFLNSNECSLQFSLESRGGVQNFVSLGTLRNLELPLISRSEQQKIANFLDHETAKIDTLITKQEKLIELLKEKRQAVISHAVTKGLNPNAPMRDSGEEWLGEVPEHWVHSTLKHYSNVIDCKHITAEFFDSGIPLASIGEVKGWFVDLISAKYTNEKYYKELIGGGRKPQVGDIIYSRNATVGEAAIVRTGLAPFAMGQDVCLIKLYEELLPEFAMYVFHSGVISQQLELAMVGSTFKRINVDNIRNFAFAIPPYQEQELIVKELEKLTSKYDKLVLNATNAIHLMKERKTALISAAVTGKIDVRDFAVEEN
tara:strand:+ start:493 stop:1863 length:1371 start_codon:yes stop_codon:yes gene_type:complete